MALPSDVVRFDFLAAAAAIEELAKAGGEEAVKGMRVIGEKILADVRVSGPGKGVPRREGVLASTLRVKGPDSKGVVTLTAGGASAPYALAQHERLDYAHDKGEARYWVRGVERFARGQVSDPVKEMKAIADAAIERARKVGGVR